MGDKGGRVALGRQDPQASQKFRLLGPPQENASRSLHDNDFAPDGDDFLSRSRGRKSLGSSQGAGPTLLRQRAIAAGRVAWLADQRTQLHGRFVHFPGVGILDPIRGQLPKPPGARAGSRIQRERMEPRQHSLHIPIHHGHLQAQAQGADGRRRVRPQSRKRQKPFECGRPSIACDGLGGLVEIAGTAVIAQSSPGGEHLFLRCPGEILGSRKPLHPFHIPRHHHFQPGLLAHDLADQGLPRIARRSTRCPPGQRTSVGGEPGKEGTRRVGEVDGDHLGITYAL